MGGSGGAKDDVGGAKGFGWPSCHDIDTFPDVFELAVKHL